MMNIESLISEFIQLELVTEKIRRRQTIKTVKDDISHKFDIRFFKTLHVNRQIVIYALKRLEKIGEGSSRIAFVLGQNKVLKVAKSNAGRAQNKVELDVYTNPKSRPIVAKITDYDPGFNWLISETAREANALDFDEILNLDEGDGDSFVHSLEYLDADYVKRRFGQKALKLFLNIGSLSHENKLLYGDIMKFSSWGVTADRRLVLLDYGFTRAVYIDHYS